MPVLQAFGQHANVPCRELLGGCLDRLLPRPLLRTGGPAHLETAVVSGNGTMVVHLLSFLPSRQAEDPDLVHDPFPFRPGTRMHYEDGYASTRVTVSEGHAMVVFTH